MGTSPVKCCSAKEAQAADTKVEAEGEEAHDHPAEEASLKIGAVSALETPREEEKQNAEPDSEPLTSSAAEEQTEARNVEEEPQTAPEPVAQEPMPVVLGTEGEASEKKNVVEATEEAEKAPAEETPKAETEQGEEKAKGKETSAEPPKTSKTSKDKKKSGDKEHSKSSKSKDSKGADDSKKTKSTAKKGADDFKILDGKDAFVGSDADAMKATDIEECKQKCRSRGYGAFIVWEGVACFRTQTGEECLQNLVDAPNAKLYIYTPDSKKKQDESQAVPEKQEPQPSAVADAKAAPARASTAKDSAASPKKAKGKPEKQETVEAEPMAATTSETSAKVDDAAKKRERKEAWKQMSDAEKKEKGSALLAAAKAGKVADVKKLLDENVSPDYVDGDGWCGLHFAAQEGKLEVTEVLIQYDADPTLQIKLGEWGQTPLHYAAKQGHREIAERLVAADKKGKALRTKHWRGKLPHELASGGMAKWLRGLAKTG